MAISGSRSRLVLDGGVEWGGRVLVVIVLVLVGVDKLLVELGGVEVLKVEVAVEVVVELAHDG